MFFIIICTFLNLTWNWNSIYNWNVTLNKAGRKNREKERERAEGRRRGEGEKRRERGKEGFLHIFSEFSRNFSRGWCSFEACGGTRVKPRQRRWDGKVRLALKFLAKWIRYPALRLHYRLLRKRGSPEDSSVNFFRMQIRREPPAEHKI